MPLTVTVGVSRKHGLPDYGSVGASCHLELELDAGLLGDPEALHARLRAAYAEVRRAVDDELGRAHGAIVEPAVSPNGHAGSESAARPPRRNGSPTSQPRIRKPASPRQLGAIAALARRAGTDLEVLLRSEYGVDRAEELTLAQASRLIDQLKAEAEV